jgi:hypothetical protein
VYVGVRNTRKGLAETLKRRENGRSAEGRGVLIVPRHCYPGAISTGASWRDLPIIPSEESFIIRSQLATLLKQRNKCLVLIGSHGGV